MPDEPATRSLHVPIEEHLDAAQRAALARRRAQRAARPKREAASPPADAAPRTALWTLGVSRLGVDTTLASGGSRRRNKGK